MGRVYEKQNRNRKDIIRTRLFFLFFLLMEAGTRMKSGKDRETGRGSSTPGWVNPTLSLLHRWLRCPWPHGERGPSNGRMREFNSLSLRGVFVREGVSLLIFLHLKNVSFVHFLSLSFLKKWVFCVCFFLPRWFFFLSKKNTCVYKIHDFIAQTYSLLFCYSFSFLFFSFPFFY